MIIGLDLSLNSTGFCLFDEVTKEYHFLANINLCAFSSKKVTPTLEEFLADDIIVESKTAKKSKKPPKPKPIKDNWLRRLSELSDVTIDSHNRVTKQGVGHIEIGHLRLKNVGMLAEAHIDTMTKSKFFLDHKRTGGITAIGLEDYSVAKITDAIVVVIEAAAYLKQSFLLPLVTHYSQIYPIPGSKMKMLAGNGNSNKLQMLMSFIDLKDESIMKSPFHKFCRENLQSIVNKRGDVESPINDIIDAFWVCKYTHDVILNGQIIVPKKARK